MLEITVRFALSGKFSVTVPGPHYFYMSNLFLCGHCFVLFFSKILVVSGPPCVAVHVFVLF